MRRITGLVGVCFATVIWVGCEGSDPDDSGTVGTEDSAADTDEPATCETGRDYAPGCAEGETPDFEAGCYEACDNVGEACPTGGTCTTVTEDPCICAAGEDCCDACGSQVDICL